MDTTDENKAIFELAYKAYWDEYREQNENWKTLETKAQGLITSNGIFMAGAFAFSREASLSSIVIIGTISTLFFLFGSMWFALKTMRTEDYQMIVDGGLSVDLGGTVFMHSTELAKPVGVRLEKMFKHLFDEHRLVLKTLEEIVQAKAKQLRYAYSCLLVASLIAVITSSIHIVKHSEESKRTGDFSTNSNLKASASVTAFSDENAVQMVSFG